MPLRRLLCLSTSASGGLRRSLSPAASLPSWAMINDVMPAVSCDSESERPSAPVRATMILAEPPRDSHVFVPLHLLNTSALPTADGSVAHALLGQVCSASNGGLLFLAYLDVHITATVCGEEGASQLRKATAMRPITGQVPEFTRFVCNPASGQLVRLPDNCGPYKVLHIPETGILTQADRGCGQPDRYAVAMLGKKTMTRFLSETGEWDIVETSPWAYQLPRSMTIDQEVLDFGGRLWWVDTNWGAVSADPFMDRPKPQIVELPRGSVLPAGTHEGVAGRECKVPRYRRMGVSEGRLRYAEVSQEEPFVLSSFTLDDENSSWTLEHRVALSRIWADGGYPWLPLQEGETPEIAVLDPLNANVMYIAVGRYVAAVDMHKEAVIANSLRDLTGKCVIPCVLPPWLGRSRIPSAGKSDTNN